MCALAVFAGCFAGADLGTRMVFPGVGAATLFPPYAVLTAALLLAPVRWWWLLLLAAAAGNFLPHQGFERSVTFVLLAEVANVTRALLAAGGVRLLGGRGGDLGTLRAMTVFIVFAVVLAPAAGAFVGAADVVWHDRGAAYWLAWQAWLLSNTLTGLTLLPLILILAARPAGRLPRPSRQRAFEAGALAVGILVVGYHALAGPDRAGIVPAVYEPLPLLLWVAVRFGPRSVILGLSAIGFQAIYGALAGQGPFVGPASAVNLLQLQSFLVAINVPILLLAAGVEDRARATRALRRSEARYRSVVEDQTEMICRFRPDGTLTFANGAYGRSVGRPPEEIVGRALWKFVPAGDHGATRALLSAITPDRPVAVREFASPSPGGESRWQHWTRRGLFDEDGRVVEYQAVGRDITERKAAEDERRELEMKRQAEGLLRASEERFRSLTDNAPVLIWMSGLRNEGVHFNKTWLEFTGRSLEQSLGSGWIESVHPDDREQCLATCNAAFEAREPLAMQFRMRRHDGEHRWVLDNGIPWFGPDGTFRGYIGTCVDITEQRRAEEALEAEARRKDEFLAVLGHELRNPLSAIAMAIEVLQARAPNRESVAWARDVVQRQLEQLTRLVDELLDISRIARGTIHLSFMTVELAHVVRQAIEATQLQFAGRNHELVVDIPSGSFPVRGDAVRLVQVVSNLLNNAAKYTDAGGRIAVTVRGLDSMIELRVTDDGVGIPTDMLESVFEMFNQIDRGGNRTDGGLGIGLTLVKRLLEIHGGTVEARSDGVGKGSEFVVRLPRAVREPVESRAGGAGAAGRRVARAAGPASDHKRILVVDDNHDAAEGLRRTLRSRGHEVLVAHDGSAALAVADDFEPDVVLLDIGLPDMSGLDVARTLRSWTGRRLPTLVATTGLGRAEDRRRTAAAGFDHHLTKPLDLERLLVLVRACPPVAAGPAPDPDS